MAAILARSRQQEPGVLAAFCTGTAHPTPAPPALLKHARQQIQQAPCQADATAGWAGTNSH